MSVSKLTDEQIDEGLRLAEAATDGPWHASNGSGDGQYKFMYDVVCQRDGEPCTLLQLNWNYRENLEADRQFIAAARTLLPAALSELKALRVSKWQDISTAPKDGTWILVYVPAGRWLNGLEYEWKIAMSYWRQPDGLNQAAWSDGPCSCQPTHWQPLPAPPSDPQPTERSP